LKEEVEDAQKTGRKVMEGCQMSVIRRPCDWWEPEKHNPDLLLGVYRNGWGTWDSIILDKNLSFRESVKLHFPVEFASADANFNNEENNAAGEEEPEGAEGAKGQNVGGIKFQKQIGWPQSRSMHNFLMALVRLAEKKRKGIDVISDRNVGDGNHEDLVMPSAKGDGAEGKTKDKEKKKEKSKDKKKKKHHHHHHHRHSHSHSRRSHSRAKSSSSGSSSRGSDMEDGKEPVQKPTPAISSVDHNQSDIVMPQQSDIVMPQQQPPSQTVQPVSQPPAPVKQDTVFKLTIKLT